MADQQLDVFDGKAEEERLWEALSSFKKVVHDLVEMTGLSTNALADTYGFGKGKVATWQNAKREAPNIPPLRFVEVLIKEAQERANLQDGAAAVFLRQYGELLKLYCSRAKPHNVHRQMLADYQNTFLIRELNNAMNAALEQMAGLTEELEALRDDRDGERVQRIALQRQIDLLGSQNQSRAVEKNAAIAQRDEVRAALAPYERDHLPVPVREQQGPDRGGSHEDHPNEPGPPPLPPPSDRGTKRRGLVLALIAAGVLVAVLAVVVLAVYAVTQLLPGDHSGPNDAAGTSPAPIPAASTGGSTGRPTNTPSAGTSATPPVTGGGPEHGGNSSSGDTTGGSSGNGTTGSSSGSASGGKTTGGSGGSGDGGGSGDSSSGGASGATSPKPPPPSGHFQLRDVGYGKCLAVSFSGAVFATCADSPATNWTTKAGSGGSYKLYNESAKQCLTVYFNQMRLADCSSGADQSWRTGTSSTVVNLSSSTCLDESSGWPILASCEPSKSTQHWAKE